MAGTPKRISVRTFWLDDFDVTLSVESTPLLLPGADCSSQASPVALSVTSAPQSGGGATTVQAYVAPGFSKLPATSRARTRKVWLPSASPVTVTGDVQAANGAVSSEQLNVEPVSFDVNVNVAPVAVVEASGPRADGSTPAGSCPAPRPST